jgi:hypothetical protein
MAVTRQCVAAPTNLQEDETVAPKQQRKLATKEEVLQAQL